MYISRFIRSDWIVKPEKSLHIATPPGHMASLREIIKKAKNLVAQSIQLDPDPAQTKITDYFELTDQIESLTSSNPEYYNILQEACKIQQQ